MKALAWISSGVYKPRRALGAVVEPPAAAVAAVADLFAPLSPVPGVRRQDAADFEKKSFARELEIVHRCSGHFTSRSAEGAIANEMPRKTVSGLEKKK